MHPAQHPSEPTTPADSAPIGAAALAAVDPAWAWAPYAPSEDRPWCPRLAAHLERRAGFGADPAGLRRALKDGHRAALDNLVHPRGDLGQFDTAFDEFQDAAARAGDIAGYNGWWLRRLQQSPDPLGERLTLLVHAHFAIAAARVGDLSLFHRHIQRLRAAAEADLRAWVRTLIEDPSVYIALGGDQNRRARPNLAFGRAWIEALVTGPGTALDADVEDAARALTGWFVYGGSPRFIAREHDPGEKSILGRRGPFGRHELAGVLGDHPDTARRLAARVFGEFIAEGTPPEALLEPVAERLRAGNSLRDVAAMVLGSNLFYSEHAVRRKIKSPIELALGLARALGVIPPAAPLVRDLANLGQTLSDPPTVGGWPRGVDWINTLTSLSRLRLCEALVAGGQGYGAPTNLEARARPEDAAGTAGAAEVWLDTLVQDALAPDTRTAILERAEAARPDPDTLRRLVLTIVRQPEYQLN